MQIEKYSGGYRIAEEIYGFLYIKDYYYYNKKDSIYMFKQFKKDIIKQIKEI